MYLSKKPNKNEVGNLLNMYGECNAIAQTIKKNNYKMNNNKSKFKTEVDEAPLAEFYKFEMAGDMFEGQITGTKTITIDGKEEVFFTAEEMLGGPEVIIPNNVQLKRKITNLVNIKGNVFPIDVHITFIGVEKIQGSANKVKTFKVLTT